MIIYISGKYTDGTVDQIALNIQTAREAAVKVWESGNIALCPHLNTAHFEDCCKIEYADYIAGDLQLVTRCDAILMLPNHTESVGAALELAHAKSLDMPVYFYPDIPPKHATEIRCPEQVKAFAEILGKMYRVHLEKNADYSPANIIATGEIGLVTRLWDKIARLMNLTGFRFSVTCEGYDAPRQPKHESIDDTLLDGANYCIIGHLLRQGKWGK